jgi:hypothetical protein
MPIGGVTHESFERSPFGRLSDDRILDEALVNLAPLRRTFRSA